ncbi:hypothetical protein LCGC14_0947330 [marine sediment metagenome]|uniref:HNH nuclease domain-containing protein n=1 Tax=marine sediment metagenome TaxID=412755 RepID=A0A0F9RPQ6_9ZZZZ
MKRKVWVKQLRELILKRDEYRCIYCGAEANGIDHVIPIAEGGFHITANAVCCCRICNSQKSKKLDDYWIIKGLQRLIQHGEDVSWIGTIIANRQFDAAP